MAFPHMLTILRTVNLAHTVPQYYVSGMKMNLLEILISKKDWLMKHSQELPSMLKAMTISRAISTHQILIFKKILLTTSGLNGFRNCWPLNMTQLIRSFMNISPSILADWKRFIGEDLRSSWHLSYRTMAFGWL